jgi:hypothetical protein
MKEPSCTPRNSPFWGEVSRKNTRNICASMRMPWCTWPEAATREDRACLLSAAHEWLRIAEKLERADQRLLPRWNEIKSHPRYRQG